MEKLTDFRPIERVELPGLGELNCSGLILIVGPNSSGKTQFLRDLDLRLSGQPRDLVVAERIDIRKPEFEPFYECLKREGYVTEEFDDAGTLQIRPTTAYFGTGKGAAVIQPSQAKSWHQRFGAEEDPQHRRKVEFLDYFGRMLVTALFLDRRLFMVIETGSFDAGTQPPQNDLHALYLNETAQTKLATEIRRTFSRGVWVDPSRLAMICLRVSDSPEIPNDKLRRSPKAMSKYRTIDTEGDGLKCYVATCVALLLGRRPVCLIDEPEMCLHPPQAYYVGRFIGEYGASPEHATFVATHSSHLLRGVIETAQQLQIIRLTRCDTGFKAHLVTPGTLSESLARPTVRAETVLDGVFAESVAIIEADGDRAVYQATWETLADEFQLDIHFTAVGGTGGIADTCKLYRTLRIPVVVIADLDILTDSQRLRRVVAELASEAAFSDLADRAKDVVDCVRRIPPTFTEAEASEALRVAAEKEFKWSDGDDETTRRALLGIARKLDRMRCLKRGGLDQLPADLGQKVTTLIEDLRTLGFFLVPVGELEGWLAAHNIQASKESKWAWASEAASLIRSKGAQKGDIWDFMRMVGRYLGKNSGRESFSMSAPGSAPGVGGEGEKNISFPS